MLGDYNGHANAKVIQSNKHEWVAETEMWKNTSKQGSREGDIINPKVEHKWE